MGDATDQAENPCPTKHDCARLAASTLRENLPLSVCLAARRFRHPVRAAVSESKGGQHERCERDGLVLRRARLHHCSAPRCCTQPRAHSPGRLAPMQSSPYSPLAPAARRLKVRDVNPEPWRGCGGLPDSSAVIDDSPPQQGLRNSFVDDSLTGKSVGCPNCKQSPRCSSCFPSPCEMQYSLNIP